MMKEPWFWRDDGLAARAIAAALSPGAFLYDSVRRLREAKAAPAAPPVPVLCVGNATLGGVGKTPFALMLRRLLAEENIEAHFLTRGYGGALAGPARVNPARHGAAEVGDEALLLAREAPAWIAKNRAAGALLAAGAGAPALILDDGYQNPSLGKTLSILLVDAGDPFGNNKVFPAGPLREPAASALARAGLVVLVRRGPQQESEQAPLPAFDAPGLNAWLEFSAPERLPPRAVAFCGVGRPERFFLMLREAGCALEGAIAFPDHHIFTDAEMTRLRAMAEKAGAPLVATEKDVARLGPAARDGVIPVPARMVCDDPALLKRIALDAIAAFRPPGEAHG